MSQMILRATKVRGPRQNLRKRRNPTRRGGATGLTHPPQIDNYEVKHTRTLRFTTGAAFVGNITFQNILDTINVATSATQLNNLFSAVKINRIRTWSLPALGQSVSNTIVFATGSQAFVGDRDFHQDSSMGIQPAHLNVRPKKMSLSALFQVSGTAVAFYMDVPAGTVVGINCSFIADALGATKAAQNASVGATVGAVTYRGLDGLALSATVFVPPAGINAF